MKKITIRQRNRDVATSISHRKQGTRQATKPKALTEAPALLNKWFDQKRAEGLHFEIGKKRALTILLPEKMNFSDQYEKTVVILTAIRKLITRSSDNKKQYRLKQVNFDNLLKISSSAALALTAELSKWDDLIRSNLTPQVQNWNPNILKQFVDLGFFDLFKRSPKIAQSNHHSSPIFVKYIKGTCGDSSKARQLKEELQTVIGDKISKWTFLHSGLTEAVTNVSHHAYPNHKRLKKTDKNWYLTGAYDKDKQELKISFYDQGIGIPKSLPTSEVWEKVLGFLSKLGLAQRALDATLLKAAMEIDRTSTGESDRGKGLQDLLEFINQRGEGYLSVVSQRGLYRFSLKNDKRQSKTHSFKNPLLGTLIIWNVSLAQPS